MPIDDFVSCEHCGTQAVFTTELSPLGGEPGHYIYECPRCERQTWVAWQFAARQQPQVDQPVQLQQQQPQLKKDEPKE